MTFLRVFILFLISLSNSLREDDFKLGGDDRKGCIVKTGLRCGSKKFLGVGDSYKISSRICGNGRYPKNENCKWQFTVSDKCLPQIQCSKMDLIGNWRRGCSGDKLTVETENERLFMCANRRKSFSTNKRTFYMDLKFTSDRSLEGKGFQCRLTCKVTSLKAPQHQSNPALQRPWSGCQCGTINRLDKIVGGKETLQHEFPWQVGLTKPRSRRPFCGGSLVSSRTVLTAAHCTRYQRPENIEVVVGDHNWSLGDGERRIKVCGKAEHPGYRSRNNDHDIALLTLCTPVQWSPTVQPVCLPAQSTLIKDGTPATVTGWGTTYSGGKQSHTLLAVNVTTISQEACAKSYGLNMITQNMLCAASQGKDACQGDSGGPLTVQHKHGIHTQVGVVSWGFGCADPRYPGVYARVPDHYRYIKHHMKGNTCDIP